MAKLILVSLPPIQRLEILEALEAVGGYGGDVNMGNPIYQVQRDFNE